MGTFSRLLDVGALRGLGPSSSPLGLSRQHSTDKLGHLSRLGSLRLEQLSQPMGLAIYYVTPSRRNGPFSRR